VDEILRLEDVHVGYAGGGEVLHGISLGVGRGERVGLLGANGAGKSTALKTVSGFLHPHAGRVLLDGEDVSRTSTKDLVGRGVVQVPEGRRVFASMTVAENLRVATYRRRSPSDEAFERVQDTFPQLRARLDLPAGLLSGGEQQMLAVGRAVMAGPRLLLLDELSLGLAPIAAQAVYAALDDLLDGLSVLLVEQNATLALAHCSHIHVLRNGVVAEHGPASAFADPEHLRAAYLGTV
jgi:branched-chain amino acid transport system ATP-binding protein